MQVGCGQYPHQRNRVLIVPRALLDSGILCEAHTILWKKVVFL